MKTYIIKPPTDFYGKPLPIFKSGRSSDHDKAIDQLVGLCIGILSDGEVNEKEAEYFNQWLRTHAPLEPVWPFTDIISRLDRIYADGICDAEEQEEMREIMSALCGIQRESRPASGEQHSTTLPLDNPPPKVLFEDKRFHITGKFAFGSRTKVIETINRLGGTALDVTPNRDANYLVVGVFASQMWANTSFGRKIERAVELRESGSGIAIIGEEHWKNFL
jgi:NAD-dependent DNA ligase